MSKLLKLKQWLTVPDAAKYLTEACEEDVTEADVLRFALDGQLTLSVYFLNEHPKAKRASYIPCKDSRLCGVLGLEGESLPYTDLDLLDVTDGQVELSGVWNLPMIAGDRLDIERRYQLKTGGQFIHKISMDGTLVVGRTSDELFQLQAYFNDGDNNYSYYPANGLPEDSILVVRTAVIQEFLGRALEPGKTAEKPAISLIDDAEREGNQVPEELDIALIAWRAACNGVKQGEKPGAFIRDWLAKNYPALSDEARKRISIVANWDKTPGAGKKSPGQ